jgi:hypothetical protein
MGRSPVRDVEADHASPQRVSVANVERVAALRNDAALAASAKHALAPAFEEPKKY